MVAYLSEYAHHFALPVELGSQVRSVRRPNVCGTFLVELADRTYEANQVVIATGPFQVPRIPDNRRQSSTPTWWQLHSSAYRITEATIRRAPFSSSVAATPGSRSLMSVGLTHHVHLAVGSTQTPLPQRLLGRDLFWYLDKTGADPERRPSPPGSVSGCSSGTRSSARADAPCSNAGWSS